MNKSILAGFSLFLTLSTVPFASAATAKPATAKTASSTTELQALRQEVDSLKQQLATMQEEFAQMKAVIMSRFAPAPTNLQPPTSPTSQTPALTVINIAGKPALGKTNAPLTLVEFSDYQCPFCGRHASEVMPQIKRDYIDTGKVRYIVRDYPLQSHQFAHKAAEAAHCAEEQGKFWEMNDLLFTGQQSLAENDLLRNAQLLNLDLAKFQSCLDGGNYVFSVDKDKIDGGTAGVRSIPAFFIGYTDPGSGELKALQQLTGAKPYPEFQRTFDNLLAQNPAKPNG